MKFKPENRFFQTNFSKSPYIISKRTDVLFAYNPI